MDALKPCPFCGGKAKLIGGGLSQEEPAVWCINGHHLNAGAEVWNTRADLDRWHRVDDPKNPPNNETVLVWDGCEVQAASRDDGQSLWWTDYDRGDYENGSSMMPQPTHWKPLPAPPEDTQ